MCDQIMSSMPGTGLNMHQMSRNNNCTVLCFAFDIISALGSCFLSGRDCIYSFCSVNRHLVSKSKLKRYRYFSISQQRINKETQVCYDILSVQQHFTFPRGECTKTCRKQREREHRDKMLLLSAWGEKTERVVQWPREAQV